MKKYEWLLFDADMTLLDFKRCERDALKLVLRNHGCPDDDFTVEEYSKINDMMWKMLERGEILKSVLRAERFRRFVAKMGFDADAEAMAVEYEDTLSTFSWMLPGARECLDALRPYYKLYIITNGLADVQHRRLHDSGLDAMTDGVFISGELGYEKPSREFFDIATSKIEGFDVSRALVIGDSLTSDIAGAVRYGIDSCWLSFGKKKPDYMPITYVINDISGLPALLEAVGE